MFDFLEPSQTDFDFETAKDYGYLGGMIDVYSNTNTPSLDVVDVVILGFPEARGAIQNDGVAYAPDYIRKFFYQLFPGEWNLKIADIGNVIPGDTVRGRIAYLTKVLGYLPKDVSVIVLGGSQEATLGITNFYDFHNNYYNISVIDAFIDSSLSDREIDNENFLTHLIANENSYLRYLNVLGLQTYYNHPAKFKIFDRLLMDYYRLGEMKNQINTFEPEIRDADIVSMDMRSVKQSDMPAQEPGSPNGFTGIEICQLARLSGIAVQNKYFGLFEYDPLKDKQNTGVRLAAQILWYYVEGKNKSQPDFPHISKEELVTFYVENKVVNLQFYKNVKTNRWWVKVPKLSMEEILFPCHENDYKMALNEKISKRIYRIINKVSL